MIILLLIFVVGFSIIGNSLKIAYPIVLVIGGLILSLIPGMPRYALTPDLVFVLFLPPLVYSGAVKSSWRDLKANFGPIYRSAIGLVAFTAIGIAVLVSIVHLHGFDWRLGLILGSVVAPTDTIAVLSIARKLGIPQHLLDIIEGESLLNDASGLVLMRFAVTIVLTGVTPTVWESVFQFTYLITVGILVGLLFGKLIHLIETKIDHAPIEVIISLLTPYVVYLVGNQLGASGILSVVTCGLYLGQYSSEFYSSNTRLSSNAVWDAMTYILNGLVFLLIGLQLPIIYDEIGLKGNNDWQDLLFHGLSFSIIVLLMRIIWLFFAANISYYNRRVIFCNKTIKKTPFKNIFIVGWAGMRGVLSLAAALAIPLTLNNGREFPARERIIFLVFCIILFSLLVQGLTLPFIIRRFGLSTKEKMEAEEKQAREIIIDSALEYLKNQQEQDDPQYYKLYDNISQTYKARIIILSIREVHKGKKIVMFRDKYNEITINIRKIERLKAIELRNQNLISDRILKKLEREIDLSEECFRSVF